MSENFSYNKIAKNISNEVFSWKKKNTEVPIEESYSPIYTKEGFGITGPASKISALDMHSEGWISLRKNIGEIMKDSEKLDELQIALKEHRLKIVNNQEESLYESINNNSKGISILPDIQEIESYPEENLNKILTHYKNELKGANERYKNYDDFNGYNYHFNELQRKLTQSKLPLQHKLEILDPLIVIYDEYMNNHKQELNKYIEEHGDEEIPTNISAPVYLFKKRHPNSIRANLINHYFNPNQDMDLVNLV